MSCSLVEYVKWRGDIALSAENFNDADNLVLCALTYVNFALCLSDGECKSFRECFERLSGLGNSRFRLIYVSRPFRELVAEAARSRRFGELTVGSFREENSKQACLQFAAMTFEIEPGFSYIAFRGTDCEPEGWRENFMLSFSEVGAQKEARRYAEETIGSGRYMIGGHSKGGNLALYAAEKLSADALSHVEKLYVNDAPGLCFEALGIKDTRRLEKICRTIRPEYSIIGSLFERGGSDEVIVKSDAKGAFQHDIVTWRVSGSSLVTAPAHCEESERLSEIIRLWIGEMSMEERQRFITDLFDTITGRNRGLEDFEKETLRFLGFSGLTLRRLSRLGSIAGGAVDSGKDGAFFVRLAALWKENPLLKLLTVLFAGMICVFYPGAAAVTLTASAASALLVNRVASFSRALSSESAGKGSIRRKALLLPCLILAYCALLFRDGALVSLSGLLCGGVLFALAAAVFVSLKRAGSGKQARLRLPSVLLRYSELVFSVLLGLLFVFSPSYLLGALTLILGNALLVDAALRSAELFLRSVATLMRQYGAERGFFVASAVENRGEV